MSRNSEGRMAQQRAPIGGAMKPRLRLDVDLTGLSKDQEAVWVREKYPDGQLDDDNVEAALDRGLQFATTEMLPNARRQYNRPGREPSDNLIRRGSSVLMVGQKADLQGEREAARARGEAQFRSAAKLSNNAAPGTIDGENIKESSDVEVRLERGVTRGRTKFPDA